MNRSKEREQAFILLFEKAFNEEASTEELFELALSSGFMEPSDFTEALAKKTTEKVAEIDAKIEQYAVGWPLSRLTKVSLSVLRIAVCELLYFAEIPVGVSINEAVELAKLYAGRDDAAFINGVLGSLAREKEAKEEEIAEKAKEAKEEKEKKKEEEAKEEAEAKEKEKAKEEEVKEAKEAEEE